MTCGPEPLSDHMPASIELPARNGVMSSAWIAFPDVRDDMFVPVKRSAKLRRSGYFPKHSRVERFCCDDIIFHGTMAGPILYDFTPGIYLPMSDEVVVHNKLRYVYELEDTKEAKEMNKKRLEGLELLYRKGLLLAHPNPLSERMKSYPP